MEPVKLQQVKDMVSLSATAGGAQTIRKSLPAGLHEPRSIHMSRRSSAFGASSYTETYDL